MKQQDIQLDGKTARGLELPLPGAPLVIAYAGAGFVMCGYLNIEAANRLNVPAAVVRGVSTVEDLLKGKVAQVSAAAAQRGVAEGMTGREALSKIA